MLLRHQAGLPAFRQPLKLGAFYDWDYMVDALAREIPFWNPGTEVCYHSFNIGWLVGEVIRRIDGRPFDEFFRQEIAEPLGLDFWFGLPVSEETRVAPQYRITDHPFLHTVRRDPNSITGLQMRHSGGFVPGHEYNLPQAHRACLPAQGGITNARGLATLYAPLASGGALHGYRLVNPATVDLMGTISSSTDHDLVLEKPYQYSSGFMKSGSWIKSGSAFGHPGSGGSLGFADPEHELAFGYVMNQQQHDPVRRQRLVDAAYQSLGQITTPRSTTALAR